ncbi:MAG: hypothetical protein EHM93_17660 [Bacteroidales bacterium]|nr:MAG: hypothetical protein EHM93_17660 [Bacteroidales bacterium]
MRNKLFIIPLTMLFSICCNKKPTSQVFTLVSADSLIERIDKYHNKKVEAEGLIIHVCSFNGKKLKLKTNNGAIIKIVAQDSLFRFDTSFYRKRVRVQGIAQEYRIEKTYIDKVEKDKTLLCHIDNTPCKDSAWVNRQIVDGFADSLSKRDVERLRRKMEQPKKEYISGVTIFAERCEIIE